MVFITDCSDKRNNDNLDDNLDNGIYMIRLTDDEGKLAVICGQKKSVVGITLVIENGNYSCFKHRENPGSRQEQEAWKIINQKRDEIDSYIRLRKTSL